MISSGKEKRFVAKDMSHALRLLTDELGSEAVLLSSRTVAEGVEIIGLPPGAEPSTEDYSRLHSDRRRSDRRSTGRRASDLQVSPQPAAASGQFSDKSPEAEHTDERQSRDLPDDKGQRMRQSAADLAEQIHRLKQGSSSTDSLAELKTQLDQMKVMLEKSVGQEIAVAESFPAPNQYIILNRLISIGFSEPVARALLQMISGQTVAELWQSVLEQIYALMPVYDFSLVDSGGIFSFRGPTGAGKTSVVLKLMAGFALNDQADEIAVIARDGAVSPSLSRLASVSGIALLLVNDQYSLAQRLAQSAHYRVVLIDMPREGESIDSEIVKAAKEIIVLPATGELGYLKQCLKQYRTKQSVAGVFTFFDYAQSIGGLISLCAVEQLRIAYISTGRFLSEDLTVPRRETIVDNLKFSADRPAEQDIALPVVEVKDKFDSVIPDPA